MSITSQQCKSPPSESSVVPHTEGGTHVAWRRLLYRGTSGAFLVLVVGTGLGLVAHIVVARLIGKDDYGLYALMLSWISVLAVAAQAGQDTNVVRFLPAYVLHDEWSKARGLRRGVGLFVLGMSVATAFVGCAVVFLLGMHHTAGWRATFYIGFAMLPILTQLQQSGAMHRAFKRAVSTNVYNLIVRPLVLIMLLLVSVIFFRKIDAPIAAAASAIATTVALGASAWHLSHAWPKSGGDLRPQYELAAWVRIGVPLSVYSVIWIVGYRVDVLILGGLMGPQDVGPYYAAATMAAFSMYVLNAVNVALGPLIAERHHVNDLAGLQELAHRAARISFVGALAVGAMIVVLGQWALGLFGPGFESAYVPLLILVFGGCVISAFGPVDAILALTAYQKQLSFIVLCGMLVNVLTAIILVPHFGAIGAAVAFALAIIVWRSLALWVAVKHLGINPLCICTRRREG